MSDQTPPKDAPAAGGNPPSFSPPSPMPPSPPYPGAAYPNPPYPNPPYPNPPDPNSGYYAGPPAPTMPPGGLSPAAAPAPQKPGGLGLVALLLALAAAVVAPIVGAIAAFQVSSGSFAFASLETIPSDAWSDLSFLSPVREWVLLGEIAFWAGTVLGVWAIVQGIVAAVKVRGRGTGIAAIVIAVVALFIFGTVVYAAGIAGFATGASLGA